MRWTHPILLAGMAAFVTLVLGQAPVLAQDAPDVPAGPGVITGRVLHAATGEPVPDAEVVVYALTDTGVPGLRRTRSAADGSYRFEGISNAPGISYLLGGRYAGVPFPGARVRFIPGANETSADIRVTELTDDPAEIEVTANEFQILRDAQGLRVLQVIEFTNRGAQTYSVAPDARNGARPAVTATIPASASGFQMPLGVIPDGIVRNDGRIAYYGPIYPGVHDLSWTFSLAGETDGDEGERFVLEGETPAGAPIRLLIPEGLGQIDAPGWEAASETHLADGRAHDRYDRDGGRYRVEFVLPPAVVDADAVRITEAQVILDLDDVVMNVRETLTLESTRAGVVMGTEAVPLLRMPLPEDATDIRFGTDAAGVQLIPHPDGGLAGIGSTGPGTFQVEVRYRRTVDSVPIAFTYTAVEALPSLSIFVGDTGEWALSSGRLHRRRAVRTTDLSYLHMEAFEVLPGETIDLTIERLPPRTSGGRWVPVAASGLLGLVAVFWLSTPLRNRAALAEDLETVSPEAREREATVASIRDLDHDFETGKISEADHLEMRETLRSRAIELLRIERAGAIVPEPDAAPEGSPQQCPACDAVVAEAHRFCPQCGAGLEAPEAVAPESPAP